MSNLPTSSDNFKNPDGAQYRHSSDYNLLELQKLLQKEESQLEISDLKAGRYLIGNGNFEGQKVFIKVATPSEGNGISFRLLNEIHFCRQFESQEIEIPKILQTGKVSYQGQNLSYYLGEFMELGEITITNTNGFKSILQAAKIIQATGIESLLETENLSIAERLASYQKKSQIWLQEFVSSEFLAQKIENNTALAELKPILNLALSNLDNWPLQLAPSHKDFSPRNLKVNTNTGKLVVLDAEHFALAPVFYDQTYFLTRLWLKNPTHGRQFFEKLVKSEAKNPEFYRQFMPVLASRLIGVSWDEMIDKHELDNLLDLAKFWEQLTLKK